MIELKPCPYCGKMPTILFWERVCVHGMWQVMCFSCQAQPKVFGRGRTKERAIEAWNGRVDDAN